MKGQITLINLFYFCIAFIVYLLVFVPVIDPIVNSTLAGMDQSSPTFTITATMFRLICFVGVLALCLTFINYGNPQREGVGG